MTENKRFRLIQVIKLDDENFMENELGSWSRLKTCIKHYRELKFRYEGLKVCDGVNLLDADKIRY